MPVLAGEESPRSRPPPSRLLISSLLFLVAPADAQRALALIERVKRGAGRPLADLDLLADLLRDPVLLGVLRIRDAVAELDGRLRRHPSVLPSDFDIGADGRLVVSPAADSDPEDEEERYTKRATLPVESGSGLSRPADPREIVSIQVTW